MRKNLLLTAIPLMAVIAMSGCADSQQALNAEIKGIHASRSVLYESIEGVANDSTLLVRGTVSSQFSSDNQDGVSFTTSVLHAKEIIPLGISAGTDVPSELSIIQFGDASFEAVPAPLLKVGQEYLLFLTRDGEAERYWVTGGGAGMYIAESAGPHFTHAAPGQGDILPERITYEEYLTIGAQHRG